MTTNTATADDRSTIDLPLTIVYLSLVALALFTDVVGYSGALAIPLLFFLPGYAILAALFPRRPRPYIPSMRLSVVGSAGPSVRTGPGLGWRERVFLSIPASIALLPLTTLGLAAAGIPLRARPVFVVLASVAVVGSLVGHLRRSRLPEEERFGVPTQVWAIDVRSAFDRDRPVDLGVNLALVGSVVLALGVVGYAVAAPPTETRSFEAALVTEQGDEWVAGDYPETLPAGEATPLTVSVENNRQEFGEFGVVVAVERVRGSGSDATVVDRRILDRFWLSVPPGETRYASRTVTPETDGSDLRLSYYLYDGRLPEDVTGANASRHLFLWVDVTDGSGEDSGADATSDSDPTGSVTAAAGSVDRVAPAR